MSYTYEELKKKTVAQLREVAKGIEHDAVKGYTQLNKDHLLQAICEALNLDMHVHHVAHGVQKTKIKQRIRKLKEQRDQAIQEHNRDRLKQTRAEIHDLKKILRKAAV